MILHPMAEDGKEAIGSMGDDAPIAVLSEKYRGLHHFFRQNFSQVTNPPIDSLRERRVMSLTTRLGNLGNILDEDESQLAFLQLDSPILLTEEYRALREKLGETGAVIDCTFALDGGSHALGDAVKRIQSEAEDAVRGGHTHLVLTDEHVTAERAALPMILATGAVHTHLVRTQLRTFILVNVRTAECLDVHYFAVLIGVGATTVNAWLAQEAIADRHRRGLFGKPPNRAHIEKVLRDLSLWDKKDVRIRMLSGGMKRRVMIAKALSHEPRILFLDEPTAGVDVELRRDMWALVRRMRDQGVTIILTTHYIDEAEEMADRIGVINKGELTLVEEKAELMRKLGRKQLTLQLAHPLAQVPAALAHHDLALSADGSELTYTYDTQRGRTGIVALLEELGGLGIGFKDLHTTQSSLEDIFVGLLKENS